ncbi:MAG: hypothetical protein ACE5I1_23185, partial [bacterium]
HHRSSACFAVICIISTMEDTMMTFGQRLMGISHRGRWILFSSLVDIHDPGRKLLKAGNSKKKDTENSPFDNDFFRSAKREPEPAKAN